MPQTRQVVVVTGASQGIGEAVSLAFAGRPATSIALVSRNRAALQTVAAACREKGADPRPFPCDVTDAEAVRRMADAVADRYGVPTAVVNNAGSFTPGGVLDIDAASFRAQIETNLTSAFLVSRAFLPAMLQRGSGHLFFMASVAAIRGYPGGAAYCAAKHGMLGLARAIREETRDQGIRVTALLPGATWTPSWEGVDQPVERFMPAGDIADALVGAYDMSDRTVVEELVLRPQKGDL